MREYPNNPFEGGIIAADVDEAGSINMPVSAVLSSLIGAAVDDLDASFMVESIKEEHDRARINAGILLMCEYVVSARRYTLDEVGADEWRTETEPTITNLRTPGKSHMNLVATYLQHGEKTTMAEIEKLSSATARKVLLLQLTQVVLNHPHVLAQKESILSVVMPEVLS